MIAQREPKSQGAEAAREFQRFFKECETLDWIVGQRLGIFPCVRECGMCSIHVTVQQAATVQRLIKPFMRIEGKRVGEIEASEFLGAAIAANAP